MLDLDIAESHWEIAAEHYEAGRLSEAINVYRTALKYAPEHPALHTNIAAAFTAAGIHDEAIAHLRKAIESDRNVFEANYGLIIELSDKAWEDPDKLARRELRDLCRLALRLDTQKFVYRNYIFYVLWSMEWRLGERKAAMKTLRNAIEANPDCAENYLTLSQMQKQTGNFVGAFRTLYQYAGHPSFDPAACVPCAKCIRRLTAYALLAVGGAVLVGYLRRRR